MPTTQHERTSPYGQSLCDALYQGLSELSPSFARKHTANWCTFSMLGRKAIFAYVRHAKNHIVVFLHRDLIDWKERLSIAGMNVLTRGKSPWEKVTPYYFTLTTVEQAKVAAQAFFQRVDDQLLPEEVPEREYIEGAVKQITVNAYERDRSARRACLNHFKRVCVVCETPLESIYGSVGAGFIHVHHRRLISAARGKYKLNPIKDLCPVCPNCHAIIHLRKPPYTIEKVRAFIKGAQQQ